MPQTAERIYEQLGLKSEFGNLRKETIETWGGLPSGTPVGEPQPLFPKTS